MTTLAYRPNHRAVRRTVERWYRDSSNGARLRKQLEAELADRLDEMFGYHMVTLGVGGGIALTEMSRVQQLIASSPVSSRPTRCQQQVIAKDEELPFETDSLDVVLLFHALDFSEHPHQLLREVHRVLRPNGHLLLVGMNPASLLGLWRRAQRWRSRSVWRPLTLLGASKVEDWLHLLGFGCEPARHKLALPTMGHGRFSEWLRGVDRRLVQANVPFGSVYLIQATKQVRGHIRSERIERSSARLIPISVGRPVAGKLRPVPRGHPDEPSPESTP